MIEELFKTIAAEVVDAKLAAFTTKPELITPAQAAEICGVDKSVILSLIKESRTNGFPSVRLSERIIKIDKSGFYGWLKKGGLNGINQTHG